MKIKAKLNNLRMAPRKVRLVANLVKGMDAQVARAQLQFFNKKSAAVILKLLNSALSNAKHNFSLPDNNFYIAKLTVEAGPSLKRWMPRAMGRATPILKRTCGINLELEEKEPGQIKVGAKITPKAGPDKAATETSKPIVEKEETISAVVSESPDKLKGPGMTKPQRAPSQMNKKFFSRQTFGNIKKVFRRKSI